MAFSIALSDEQWELVADLFDPPARRGAPARIERRSAASARVARGRLLLMSSRTLIDDAVFRRAHEALIVFE